MGPHARYRSHIPSLPSIRLHARYRSHNSSLPSIDPHARFRWPPPKPYRMKIKPRPARVTVDVALMLTFIALPWQLSHYPGIHRITLAVIALRLRTSRYPGIHRIALASHYPGIHRITLAYIALPWHSSHYPGSYRITLAVIALIWPSHRINLDSPRAANHAGLHANHSRAASSVG